MGTGINKSIFENLYPMVKVDLVADNLRTMVNAERLGRKQVMLKTSSKTMVRFLRVMQKHGYVGEFEIIDDHRQQKIVVELIGRINKCGVISPRFDVKNNHFEKWCNNILPSRQFGYLVMTTPYGIMDHEEAKKIQTGGKILGFFY